MRAAVLALSFIAALCVTPVRAVGFYTGNQLLEQCEDGGNTLFCYGFVAGVVDMKTYV